MAYLSKLSDLDQSLNEKTTTIWFDRRNSSRE